MNLTYTNPHTFSHGHAVFSIQHAKDLSDLKAISINLMLSSIKMTDIIYAVLSENEVVEGIGKLGDDRNGQSERINSQYGVIKALENILEQLKKN